MVTTRARRVFTYLLVLSIAGISNGLSLGDLKVRKTVACRFMYVNSQRIKFTYWLQHNRNYGPSPCAAAVSSGCQACNWCGPKRGWNVRIWRWKQKFQAAVLWEQQWRECKERGRLSHMLRPLQIFSHPPPPFSARINFSAIPICISNMAHTQIAFDVIYEPPTTVSAWKMIDVRIKSGVVHGDV